MKRSCDALGVCQAESGRPRCAGCVPHAYAPGTIEAHRRPVSFWAALASQCAKLAGVCAVVAFSLGYASGRGWL